MSLPFRWEIYEVSDPLPTEVTDGEVELQDASLLQESCWQIHEPDVTQQLAIQNGGEILAAEEEPKVANASTDSDEKTEPLSKGGKSAAIQFALLSVAAIVGLGIFTFLSRIIPSGTIGVLTITFAVCFLMVFIKELATSDGLTVKTYIESVQVIFKEMRLGSPGRLPSQRKGRRK